MMKKKVSIVICTYKRVDLLKGAVQSLIEQSIPASYYEVIVVDNEEEKNLDVQEIVEQAKKNISIQYLHEETL